MRAQPRDIALCCFCCVLVFEVIAQTPANSGTKSDQVWDFYFTEIDGRVYSLTTRSAGGATEKVAADVGDVRQVASGTIGCTIAERTPIAFAQAIREALTIPGTKTNGRDHIMHLSLEVVAQRVLDLYQAAVACHRGRALATVSG